MAETDAKLVVSMDSTNLVDNAKKGEKAILQIGAAGDSSAKKLTTATDQMAGAAKKLSGAATEAAKQVRQIAVAEVKGPQRVLQTKTEERELGRRQRSVIKVRGQQDVLVQEAKTETKIIEGEERRQTATHIANEKLRVDATKIATRERIALEKQVAKQAAFSAKQASPWYALGWQAKTGGVPASQLYQSQLNQQIARSGLYQQMGQQAQVGLRGGVGMLPSQVWQQQMNQATARSNAANANFFAQQNQAAGGGAGGAAAGGRGNGLWRGGGWQRLIGGGAGGFAAGMLGGLGIGVGGYAVARAGRAVVEAAQLSTAYDRQRIAAEKLAGGQTQLNALLQAYGEASGGAIDKTTTLEKTTRLLATGFANSVEDVTRFVKATRGASIALGKPQDYVIQETQLAISNTSVKRLDQIGLGIKEVQDRIKELRKENVGWTREVSFQEAVISLLEEKYGSLSDTVEGQKTGLEKLGAAWSDLNLALGQNTQGPINAAAQALSDWANALIKAIEAADEAKRKGTFKTGSEISPTQEKFFSGLSERAGVKQLADAVDVQAENRKNWEWLMDLFGQGLPNHPSPTQLAPRVAPPIKTAAAVPPPLPFGATLDEQVDVIRKGFDDALQIEENYNKSRLNEIQQYEEQRADVVRNYAKQVAREEQDFYRQRVRGLRDYERSIVDVMRDASERDVSMREDLDKQLSDFREASNEKVAEIEKNYQEDREKAEKEHRDRLLTAAGQLDAIAVLEERKRWKLENSERDKGHKEAIDDQKKDLQKQIDNAREAYEERLADARKADARRLEDMASDRARQLADEDEDRAISKARAAEDYQDQLNELDRQHKLTMERLATEAEAQRTALQDALEANLAELGYIIDGYNEKIAAKDKVITDWFDKIILKIEKMIAAEQAQEKLRGIRPEDRMMPTYASGGSVPFTGLAMLHAGEYVLSRGMLAASTMNSSSYNNRNITFQSGAIQVQTVPGAEYMVADLVEERLIALLGRV